MSTIDAVREDAEWSDRFFEFMTENTDVDYDELDEESPELLAYAARFIDETGCNYSKQRLVKDFIKRV